MYYNSTKGGVDAFDKIVADGSVARKTARWPMTIFYGMINISVANAWIIFNSRSHGRRYDKHDFMHDMAYSLASDHAKERYRTTKRIDRHLRETLRLRFNIPEESEQQPQQPEQQQPQEPLQQPQRPLHQNPGVATLLGRLGGRVKDNARQRCRFDDRTSSYSCKIKCNDCKKTICDKHSHVLCQECLERQEKWILYNE